jgi:hypothetical protein
VPGVTPTEVTLNGFFTAYGHGYRWVGGVGLNLCPRIPPISSLERSRFIRKPSWLRQPASTVEAYGEAAKNSALTLSNTSYSCQAFQSGENLYYELLDEGDPIGLAERATDQTIDKLLLDAELRIRDRAWAGLEVRWR